MAIKSKGVRQMFERIKATHESLCRRSSVYGVGVNDSDYQTQPTINGKKFMCPIYQKWVDMLQRCYSTKFQEKHPSYIGCTVCKEWLLFSKFKAWMESQDWEGKELDKDILINGNKEYSPIACIFVSHRINSLLANNKTRRGAFPIGVNFDSRCGKYMARLNINCKLTHVGCFDTPKLALDAYIKAKYKVIKEVALSQSEPLKSALLNYIIKD